VGTAVPDVHTCTRINRRAAVLRGAILGRQCSLQVRSEDMVLVRMQRGTHLLVKGESKAGREGATQRAAFMCVCDFGAWQCQRCALDSEPDEKSL